MVQVKNGPIDFQPREPFHPLFGAMPHTPLMMEVEITKEYLGFNTHLAYLGTMWAEVLDTDTWQHGQGTTVARVLEDGKGTGLTGMAGVSNIGNDRDWTGRSSIRPTGMRSGALPGIRKGRRRRSRATGRR